MLRFLICDYKLYVEKISYAIINNLQEMIEQNQFI